MSESESVWIGKYLVWKLSELEIISVENSQNWKVIYLGRDTNDFRFISLGLDLSPHFYVYVPFVKKVISQIFFIIYLFKA